MKTFFTSLRVRGASMKAAVAGAALVAASQAHAELPTWATGMFTALEADVESVLTLIGPVIMAVIAGFTVIKLIKRGSAKI